MPDNVPIPQDATVGFGQPSQAQPASNDSGSMPIPQDAAIGFGGGNATPAPNSNEGSIGPSKTGFWEQAKSVISNSPLGYALEKNLPKVSDALNIHPTETIYSPEYQAHHEEILPLENLVSPTSQNVAARAARGVLKTGAGLTTPTNLTIMAATGGLGLVADAPAVAATQRLISAGFGYEMIKGATERYPQIKEAIQTGDYATAAELISQSASEAALAGQAVKHAAGDVHGEQTGRTQADEATKKLLQDRLDARQASIVDATSKMGKGNYFRPEHKSIAGVDVPIPAAKHERAPFGAKVAAYMATPGKATEFAQSQTRPAATTAAVSTLGQMTADKVAAHTALRAGEAAPDKISGTDTPAPYHTVDDAQAALESGAKPTYQTADAIDAQERAAWEAQKKVAVDAHKAAIDSHNQQVGEANAEGESLDTIPFDETQADLPERPKFLSELRAAEDAAWHMAKNGNAEERAQAYEKDIPKAEKDTDNWFKQHESQIPAAEYESAKDLTYRAKRLETIAASLRAPMLNNAVSSRTLNGIEAKIDNQAIRRGQAPGAFRKLLGDEGYQNWKNVVDVLKSPEKADPNAKPGLGDMTLATAAFSISLLSHIWGGALGTIIPLKYASRFILDRALFNPEFGKFFTENFNRFKSSGGKMSSDMINSFHNLMTKNPMSDKEARDAGFSQDEVETNQHTPIVGPKLSQGPAPTGGGENYAYRARNVGEKGVPVQNTHAQATLDPTQAAKYAEAGQRNPEAGEVVKVDLNKLKPEDYTVREHPDGQKWVKFNRPLDESELEMHQNADGTPAPKLSQRKAKAKAPATPSTVTETPEFKSWFGESKVTDEEGQPKVLYHGTTHAFNEFAPERGNIAGHFGKGIYFSDSPEDAGANYAGEGPDLTSRIEQRAEQIANEENLEQPKYGTPEYKKFYADLKERAKKELTGEHGGAVMPTYVKMENPIDISQRGNGTNFEINVDDDGNESGSGMKLYQAVHDTAGQYGIDPSELWGQVMEKVTDFSDFSAKQFDRALDSVLNEKYIDDLDTDEGNAVGELKRQIYQAAGFDGIVETASDSFPKMKGIPQGTKHYIAFEPEQVKSATGNSGAFDAKNPDIRLSEAPVSLADWDQYRESHPITQDHIERAFPGQDVQKIDDRNFSVKLDNGNNVRIHLQDVVDGGGVEIRPGNAVYGRWDSLDDGGIMRLANIAGENTLRHETFHAAMDILPQRLKDAVLKEYGDEEKAADAYGDWKPETKPDSIFGQVRDYFQQLYDKIFRPAQEAFRKVHEGRVWDQATEKFAGARDLRPDFSVKTYPKWEKDFRKTAADMGASQREIDDHIKTVEPAFNMFRELTDTPPDLPGSNMFDNAWEGKKTTFEYQGFCPKNKNFNPTKAAIEKEIGRFLNKQETTGLTLLMHSEALDSPCNYCYTLAGQGAVSENLGNTARKGVWVGGDNIPETSLKLETRPHPDKPGATQSFLPPVDERLLTDEAYRDKQTANDPELAEKVKLQQWYGDKKVYGNLKAHKPTEEGIIPARGALLRMSDEHIAQVNSKRGFRVSGNVDVTPYSYMDVAQDMADARLRGAKRYSYTKQSSYVRLVGNTGEKINMSLTMNPLNTDFITNDWSDSMNFNDAKALRKEFPNAGTMLMAFNDNHILAGLKSPDVDMMIPYHGTRGKFPANIKEFVQDYSRENHETNIKTGETVSGDKEIKQTEHQGDLQTYLRICKERGYLPKFARFIYDNVESNKTANGVSSVHLKVDPETGEPENPVIRKDTSKNFMKLVKDIARTDSPHEPIKRNVDMKHLEEVVNQIKTGNMPWSGQSHDGVTKTAADRLRAGKPLYNGEMGFSYTPAAEVPAAKLVQIAPAPAPAAPAPNWADAVKPLGKR